MPEPDWTRVFASFRPGLRSDAADLARAEAALGYPLPPSYAAFARACGAGLVGGQVRVFTPVPVEAADLVTRSGLIAHAVARAIDGLSGGPEDEPHRFTVEGDADAALTERAGFFGQSAGGAFLFFDVVPDAGEYEVWVLAADLTTIRYGGASLDDCVERLLGPDGLHVLGEGDGPLPATFEGDDAAALARLGAHDPDGARA